MPLAQPADPTLRVVLVPARERLLVSVIGEIDMATSPAVDDAVASAFGDAWGGVVIDLRGIEFMDSAGLHLLTRLARRNQDRVCVELLAGTPEVERLLGMAGAGDVLPRADPSLLPPAPPR